MQTKGEEIMTQDNIIRMTAEASGDGGVDELTGDAIERFYHLAVAAEREVRSMRWDEYIAKAISAEREACALLAQQFGPNRPIATAHPSRLVSGRWEGEQAASAGIAAAIRARSQS
jgi:hypothetical protein